MRSILLSVVLALLAAPSLAASTGGVEFPDALEWRGASLRLRGLGVLRYRVFFDAYAAAFYLGEGVAPERALAATSSPATATR